MKRGRGRCKFRNWAVVLFLGSSCLLGSCSKSEEQDPGAIQKKTMVPGDRAAGVCFLKMNRKYAVVLGQNSTGTGVLIDGRYVLTAAHSLYDPPSEKGRLRSIRLAVGRADVSGLTDETADSVIRRDREDLGRLPQDGVWSVSPEYQARLTHRSVKKSSGQLVGHDYGFVDLGKDFGKKNSFRLTRAAHFLKVGSVVRVAGYPGEPGRIKGATGTRLFEGEGRITTIRGSLFGYDIQTSKGMSGGPVWVERGGRRELVGIHLGSDIGGIEGAVFRAIDQPLLNDWDDWVQACKGHGAL